MNDAEARWNTVVPNHKATVDKRSVTGSIFRLCCDMMAVFYSGRVCIGHLVCLNMSTVVLVATADLLGMTTVIGVATSEGANSDAPPRGESPDVGAGKGCVRSIKCEPTPVPTAGEKMRSSSSVVFHGGISRGIHL
jgi:hypothetical protein